MSNFVELSNLPVLDLYKEFNTLIETETISWHIDKKDQICINTVEDCPDDIHIGRGSLTYDWDSSTTDENGNIEVPLRKKLLQENNFVQLATPFKNTLFEEVYNALNKRYHLGRVRIMNSMPKTCLTWHTDATLRVHYPLKTQSGCFMVINDEVKYLEKDKWYWANTRLPHTAVNSSKENRLHLVAVIIGER